jgi:hypothetical protein
MTKIVKTYALDSLAHKDAPLWWHVRGLSFTRSGYGKRIPTRHMVKIPGSPRWRRVYCAIFSNAGTCYVEQGNDWIVIR